MKAGLKAAAAAVAWILLAACLLVTKYADRNTPALSAAAITEKAEVSGSKRLTFDISMPVVSGLGDKELEQSLNGSIERQISLARDAAVKAADEHWRKTSEEGFEPWSYAFFAEYDVKQNKGILSLKVTTLLYTGGPGMPRSVCYNVDMEKNKLLALSDLFIDDSYIEKINSIIIDKMAKDSGRYVPASGFTGVTDETQFFISGDKLFITFAKYEVAAGAAGEPEFLIPAEEIKGILKGEYREVIK